MGVDHVRSVMLQIINEADQGGQIMMQEQEILRVTAERLNAGVQSYTAMAILDTWHDLYRVGYIAWGIDLNNSRLPWFHITPRGQTALRTLSCDPANPVGYMAHLRSLGAVSPTVCSYVEEALRAYQATCYRAAAILIGTATECVVLDVRDSLVIRLQQLGKPPSQKLRDWKILQVIAGIENELLPHNKQMGVFGERFVAHWPAVNHSIRTLRNDAGHPASIEPITADSTHAVLLLFPVHVELALQLVKWIPTGYV